MLEASDGSGGSTGILSESSVAAGDGGRVALRDDSWSSGSDSSGSGVGVFLVRSGGGCPIHFRVRMTIAAALSGWIWEGAASASGTGELE